MTLGLEEGLLFSTVGLLVLVALVSAGAPMHRLLGPPVLATLGAAAYLLHSEGAFGNAISILSFSVFGFLGFFLPLAVLRYGWRVLREPERFVAPEEEFAPPAAAVPTRPMAKIGTIRVPVATPTATPTPTAIPTPTPTVIDVREPAPAPAEPTPSR